MATGLALVLNAALLAQGQPIREGMSLQEITKAFGEPELTTTEGQKRAFRWRIGGVIFTVNVSPEQTITRVREDHLRTTSPFFDFKEEPFPGVFNFKDLFQDVSSTRIFASLDSSQRKILQAWLNQANLGSPPSGLQSPSLRAYHEFLRRRIVDGDAKKQELRRLVVVEETLRLRAAAQGR